LRETKTLNLLLVEDDLEDERLLCEALLEIEENRQWSNWRSSSVLPVDRLADALDCLRRRSFDAVLLNLSLPDSPTLLDSFFDVNACAGLPPSSFWPTRRMKIWQIDWCAKALRMFS
jgi:CheY-like chemotaxis protein